MMRKDIREVASSIDGTFGIYGFCAEGADAWTASPHSHSIVPGGFDVMS